MMAPSSAGKRSHAGGSGAAFSLMSRQPALSLPLGLSEARLGLLGCNEECRLPLQEGPAQIGVADTLGTVVDERQPIVLRCSEGILGITIAVEVLDDGRGIDFLVGNRSPHQAATARAA